MKNNRLKRSPLTTYFVSLQYQNNPLKQKQDESKN